MQEFYPFDDFQPYYSPFGPAASGNQDMYQSPPMVPMDEPPSMFPHDAEDDISQEGSIFHSDQSSELGISGSTSPVSSSSDDPPSFTEEFCVKSEPEQQEEMLFDSGVGVPAVVVPNTPVHIPERKKRRRSSEPKANKPVSGKKRKSRSEDAVAMDMTELASKTSEEIDLMIKARSSAGTLNAEDVKRLKHIRRQVKNRESAQVSRNRHRDYVNLIEAELEYQRMVSQKFREYAESLKKRLVDNNLELPPEPIIPPFVPPSPSDASVLEPMRAVMRPLRTAGVCVVLFVLSLGIVLNMMHHMSRESSVSKVGAGNDSKTSLVPMPAATEPSARVMADSSQPVTQLSPTEGDQKLAPDSIDVIRKSTYLTYSTEKEDSSLALVIPNQKQEVSMTGDDVVPRGVMPYTTKTIFGSAKPRLADRSWSLDNTSYILVNDATEFVSRDVNLDRVQARTEPVIGLLIPASSFNIPNLAPDDVVELVCGVRNATLVPRHVLSRSLF